MRGQRPAIKAAPVEKLPPLQLSVAVAFAACWHVCARRPTSREMDRAGIRCDNKTLIALRDKGLLELNPRARSYQPTSGLLEQLGCSGEVAAE